MFLPTPFAEPKPVAAREKELKELLAKSADAKRHESRGRDHFALNRGWHGACSKKYVRGGGGKVRKRAGGRGLGGAV